MLSKCGDVSFKWKKYLNVVNLTIPKVNLTKSQVAKCVEQNDPFELINSRQQLQCDCPPPCHEVQYHATWVENKNPDRKRKVDFSIMVTYKDQVVTTITEIPTSTIPHLLAEFGGILGLLSGMSALTIAELVFCFVITMAMYLNSFKNIKR